MKSHVFIIAFLALTFFNPLALSQAKQGFEFTEVQDGSVYQKMGLKKGDVIQKINGKPIADASQAKEALEKIFAKPGKVELQILRNGKPMQLHYEIK